MANYTCLALVNSRQDGGPVPEHDELLARAADVIVVFDLDDLAEMGVDADALIGSAIDGEYGEAIEEGLALRINSWARHADEVPTGYGRKV